MGRWRAEERAFSVESSLVANHGHLHIAPYANHSHIPHVLVAKHTRLDIAPYANHSHVNALPVFPGFGRRLIVTATQ